MILTIGVVGELPVGAALDGLQTSLQGPLRRLLNVEIEAGIDPVARGVEVSAKPGLQLLPDVLDEVFSDSAEIGVRRKQQGIGLPALRLLGVQQVVVAQQVYHRVPALHVEIGVAPGVVAGGGFRNGGEGCRFSHIEIRTDLPK